MKIARFQLTGPELSELAPRMRDLLDPPYLMVQEPVVVMMAEEFYFRTDSNLLTTLIVVNTGPDSAVLELVTGGGKAGMLGLDWGAEQSRNLKMVEHLQQLCATHGWTIAKEEWFG